MKLTVYKMIFFVVALSPGMRALAQSDTHRGGSWCADNNVNYVDYSNGYTMLSGLFDQIGPYTAGGVLFNGSSATTDDAMPKINGSVLTSVSDGNGGWYIGGYFQYVGDVAISNLIHINSDKTLDTNFKPNPDYEVQALAMGQNILYIGGNFQKVSGQTRSYLAAVNSSTGTLTSWNPTSDGIVNALAIIGTTLYAGGNFAKIGATARNKIAAIDATTGVATAWNPNITGSVSCIVAGSSGVVYAGGAFTKVGAFTRTGFAAINTATGIATTLNPPLQTTSGTPSINTMLLVGDSILYLGGYVQVKGLTGQNLVAISLKTGNGINWNPILDNTPYSLAISGTTLYVGGNFSTVNYTTRNYLAAISTGDASLLDWNPQPSAYGSVNTLLLSGSSLFAGGYFNGVNWIYRNHFALVQDATGQPWPFTFDLNGGSIYSMAIQGTTLYVGGSFSAINKSVRRNLAAFDLTTGALLPWAPSAIYTTGTTYPAVVNSIRIKDNLLYVGGRFGTINNGSNIGRINFAAVDLTTGNPSSLNINVGSSNFDVINSLDIAGNTVYVAGTFGQIGSTLTRYNLGAIDVSAGSILPWAPVSNGPVSKIKIATNAAYVVGTFDNGIGGSIRTTGIAALNLTTGLATSWNPPLKGGLANDITLTASDIYVGGTYDSIASERRFGLSSFSLSTGILNAWSPDVKGGSYNTPSVTAIAASNNRIHVGGGFEAVGNEVRKYYTEYDLCPNAFDLVPTGSVLTAPTAATYQWYKNGTAIPGATAQTLEISFLENGTYYVVITLNGCTGQSNDYIYLITGQVKGESSLIKVFPNPVKEELFIEVPQEATARMMDVMGRSVTSSKLMADQTNRIETHDLTSGTYILIVKTGNATNYFKILKIH